MTGQPDPRWQRPAHSRDPQLRPYDPRGPGQGQHPPPPQRRQEPPTHGPPPRGSHPYTDAEDDVPYFEDDLDEEISEEEFEDERRRLRRGRAVRSAVSLVVTVLAALVVVALLVQLGVLPSSVIPNIMDNFKPTALTTTDLTAPALPSGDPPFGEAPPTASGVGPTPAVSYTITWTTTQSFVHRGGTMRVNITNGGTNRMYVEQVRMAPDWGDPFEVYATGFGWYVDPGEEQPMGLLAFPGPDGAGLYNYHFELDLYVQRPLLGTWAHISGERSRDAQMEVFPIEMAGGYPVHTNDKDIYRKVNDLVRPTDQRVAQLASEVRAGMGGEYNVYWVASLFDWVISELTYRSDPSDSDEWSPPGPTCDSREGDCEDYSILISSVVEHWGGNSRFYIISKHAFAAVYLGPRDMDPMAVANALNSYYGTSARYSWFVDELGYWIIADGTSSQYLGGLPYNGVATDDQGGWDIQDTEYLYVTDIYPGYPE